MADTNVLRQRVAAIVAAVAVVLVVLAVIAAITVVPSDRLPNLIASPQLVGHAALAVAIVLAGIGVLAFGEGYLAGVWIVSSLIAWTAAAGSVVVYLATGAAGTDKGFDIRFAAVYDGVAIALVALAALAFLGREVCRPTRAQPRIWDSIQDRHSQLHARYEALVKAQPLTPTARRRTRRRSKRRRSGSRRSRTRSAPTSWTCPISPGPLPPATRSCFGRCTGSRR